MSGEKILKGRIFASWIDNTAKKRESLELSRGANFSLARKGGAFIIRIGAKSGFKADFAGGYSIEDGSGNKTYAAAFRRENPRIDFAIFSRGDFARRREAAFEADESIGIPEISALGTGK